MKSIGFTIDNILATKESATQQHRSDERPHVQYRDTVLDYSYHYHRYFPYPAHAHAHHRHHYRRRSVSPPQPLSPDSSTFALNDELDGDKLSRRPRTSITVCQREFLEQEFQKERYPTLAYIDKLSRKVHLQQYVIKVWFQNRRAKYRKEGHRRKQQKPSPTADNKNNGSNDDKHDSKDIQITRYTNSEVTHREQIDFCNSTHSSKYASTHSSTKYHNELLPNLAKSKMFTTPPDQHCSMTSYPWRRVSRLDKTSSSFCKSKCRCLMCQDKYMSL